MNVIEKISYYQRVWEIALPHFPAPKPGDIRFWTDFDSSVVEAAILQASNRFAESQVKPDFDVTRVYRYITGTAKGMAREAKEAEISKLRASTHETVQVTIEQDNRGNRL